MENSTELCHSYGRGPRWPPRNPSPVDEVFILTKETLVLPPPPPPWICAANPHQPEETVRLPCSFQTFSGV